MEPDLETNPSEDPIQPEKANSAGNDPHPPYEFSFQAARTGHRIACLNGKALSSSYDPQKEGLRLAQGLLALARKQEDIRHIIIVGAGSPYLLKALQAEAGEASLEAGPLQISIYEPVPEVYQWICENQSYRMPVIQSRQEALQYVQSRPVLVFPNRSLVQNFAMYRRAFEELHEAASRRQINLNTLSKFGSLWARNLYANFPRFLGAAELTALKGAGRGKPAIVLGAGPSLSDHLPAIAASPRREDFLVIAVDTALSVCRIHGLEPDFALTVDPQPINFYHMAGESFRRTILLADSASSPLALRRWAGRLIRLQNAFPLSRELARISGHTDLDSLGYGGSVSTNAYDLALYLGCSEVLMVGQDLSFPASKVHASGAALEELWSFREHRLSSRETGNYRQRFSVPVVHLPSETGAVHSNDKLNVFFNWFNRRFSEDTDRIQISLLRTGGVAFTHGQFFQTFSEWESQRVSAVARDNGVEPDPRARLSASGSPSATGRSTTEVGSPASGISIPGLPNLADLPEPAFQKLRQALRLLKEEFQALVDACASEKLLFANLDRLARAIRLAGTGMQREIEELKEQGKLSDDFRMSLKGQAARHARMLHRLLARLDR